MSMFWATCQPHGQPLGNTYQDNVTRLLPSAYWKMDETSGTVVADSSINGLDGVSTPSLTRNNQPLITVGYSDLYNGSDSSVTVLHNPSMLSDNQTIVGFFQSPASNPSDLKGIFSKCDDRTTSGEYLLVIRTDGVLRWLIRNQAGTSYFADTPGITDGLVHQFALVKQYFVSGDVCGLYVDGVFKTSITMTGGGHGAQSTNNIYFGITSGDANSTRHYSGPLDEFSIFNYALTPTQIADLYATRNNPI